MNNEVTVINPEQFGLEKKEATNIEKAFEPKIKEREILSVQYGELVKKDITQETCIEATELRRKLVKVRTGISDIHKSQKSFFLAAGKFVDAWKNKETIPVTQMEDGLRKIENHFAEIEEAKREIIRKERNAELEKYDTVYGMGDIALMDTDVWRHFLSGVKSEFEEKKEVEKKAEAERVNKLMIESLRWERAEEIKPYYDFFEEKEGQNLGEICQEDFDRILIDLKKKKSVHEKDQEKIRKENERLKKEAKLKIIADEKAEKKRQRLVEIEQDKRDKIERERQVKERKLEVRNSNRNKELKPYIVFIRDYSGLFNSEEKEYRKQLEDIKEGAELQWMSDRKEQQRKAAQEKIDLEEKEMLRKESVEEIEANRKAELAPDKEKLTKWIDTMNIGIETKNLSQESEYMVFDIYKKHDAFKKWATEQVNKIK